MLEPVYARYVAASAASLGVDFGLFMLLLSLGMPSAAAAAGGYVAGIACHWLLSSRAVFVGRVADAGAGRQRQQAMFLGSALVGLAITSAIVGAGTHFGLDPRLAKLAAILTSFQVTYLLRQKLVFS
ncbi:MAG TPA: GtrA family protein [Sphingomicrobium sp.]|nr:GtrA family protein [Sphingomicrobium sp.]